MKNGSQTAKLSWFTIFILSLAFLLPSLSGLVSTDLSYALMDETGFVLSGKINGLFLSLSKLVEQYHSEGWQRNHFVGLFLDQFVGWAWPSPRSFRVLRLVESIALSMIFLGFLNQFANRLGKRIKLLFFFATLSAFGLFYSRPLFFASIYEFEGVLLSMTSFYLLVFSRTKLKWVGLALIPVLWFTKETFVAPSFTILLFMLLAPKLLVGNNHRISQKQRWAALALLAGTAITAFVFIGNRKSPYAAQHSESQLDLFPEYAVNILTSYSNLTPFVLIVLFVIMIVSQTVSKNLLWQESRNAFVISAFFGLVSYGYGAMLFPWGKNLWSSYYYLPLKLWGGLSLCLFVLGLFNHVWPKIRNHKLAYSVIGVGLIFIILINGVVFHRKTMSKVIRSHEIIHLNSYITNLSDHHQVKPLFFTYLTERGYRIAENEILLGQKKRPYTYDVVFSKDKLIDCWISKTCKFVILDEEAMDSELETIFSNHPSLIAHDLGGFKAVFRP